MRKAKFISGILAASLMLGSVQLPALAAEDSMPEEQVVSETNEDETTWGPVISLDGDAMTLTSDNNCVYFTPEETGGYALHFSSDDNVYGYMTCEYYFTDMGEGWSDVCGITISNAYGDAGYYTPDQELACYLEAGTTYRFCMDDFTGEGGALSVTLETTDKAEVVDGMEYSVLDGGAVIDRYTGTDREVTIPSEINGYPVNRIGDRSFSSNMFVEKVYISEGISRIGWDAFRYCSNLNYVSLPSTLEVIAGNPFRECGIETIALADGSNGVKDGAFIWENRVVSFFDWSITEYTVPDGVKYIGDSAFDRSNIEDAELKTVILPESVVSIGSRAFTCDVMQRDFGVEDVYIKNAYCEIASDSFDEACDYMTDESWYAVTIHAPSGGTVEQFCQEQGIPFVAEGEAQQYFQLTQDGMSAVYRYSDGKFYGTFTPDYTSQYHFFPCWGDFSDVTVIDSEGNAVEPVGKSAVFDYLSVYYLQEGKEYKIIIDKDEIPLESTRTHIIVEEEQQYFPLVEDEECTVYRYSDGQFYATFTPNRTAEYLFYSWYDDFCDVTVTDSKGNAVEPAGKWSGNDDFSTYHLEEGQEYKIIIHVVRDDNSTCVYGVYVFDATDETEDPVVPGETDKEEYNIINNVLYKNTYTDDGEVTVAYYPVYFTYYIEDADNNLTEVDYNGITLWADADGTIPLEDSDSIVYYNGTYWREDGAELVFRVKADDGCGYDIEDIHFACVGGYTLYDKDGNDIEGDMLTFDGDAIDIEMTRHYFGKMDDVGSISINLRTVSVSDDTKVSDVIKTTVNGVTGWYYTVDGKVDTSYTGFASNKKGDWYIEKGKVTFKANSVIQDTTGALGTKNAWYYVVRSEVQNEFTGLADYSNKNGWWYIKNGKVDFNANTIAKNKNGWWYIKGGRVRFDYTGFGTNENGKWYVVNGRVKFNVNSVIKDETGALGTKGSWYYVVGNKVQEKYTGVANYSNKKGWWYIKNGKVDFTANTVAKNKNGWWKITKGKVDFSFTGIASNSNGKWYIQKGKVNFNYTGKVKYNGKTYRIVKGKVQ